jgi:hypothetical protein
MMNTFFSIILFILIIYDMRHHKAWFLPGRKIVVRDKMQRYTYTLTFAAGTNLKKGGQGIKYEHFNPHYTPQQMLVMGVFEGKYMNDCEHEFPIEWYRAAKRRDKLRPLKADPSVNYFKIKSRLSLQEWRRRKWVPCHPKDRDVRGWFQWYCRYWIGRRIPEVDIIQINRWKSFARHYAQVKKNARGDLTKRPRQRQALLQWSWDCKV